MRGLQSGDHGENAVKGDKGRPTGSISPSPSDEKMNDNAPDRRRKSGKNLKVYGMNEVLRGAAPA